MGEITFHSDDNNWVMKISDKGIKFNLERWPDSSPDDFARAIIEILERNYKLKFYKYEKMGKEE